MSRINKYNYEAFLLDFAEGQLSTKDNEALLDFLSQHPEYQTEFDVIAQEINLTPFDNLFFERKELLCKDELADKDATLIIAHLEGIASFDESLSFTQAMKGSANLAQEYRIYQNLVFSTIDVIGFDKKETLLQPIAVPLSTWIYRASFGVAAAFLLLLFGYSLLDSSDFSSKMVYKFREIQHDTIAISSDNRLAVIKDKPINKEEVFDSYSAHATEKKGTNNILSTAHAEMQVDSMINDDKLEWIEMPLAQVVDFHHSEFILNEVVQIPTNGSDIQFFEELSFVEALALESGAARVLRNVSLSAFKEIKELREKKNGNDFFEFELGTVHTRIQKPFRNRLKRLRLRENNEF